MHGQPGAGALRPAQLRLLIGVGLADLAIHFPGDPEQQHAARQGQSDHREQLHGKIGKQDRRDGRGRDPEQNAAPPPFGRKPRRRHSDDDRVVSGEHHVDDDHRQQCAQLINADQHHRHIITDLRSVETVTMSRAVVLHPAMRLSAFYAASFLVTGIQLPFWPVWLASRGLTAREIGVLLAAAIWVKVLATPAIGALADKTGGRHVLMGALAAAALAAYAGLLSAGSFWLLILLNLVALTAQSALMPLGDTMTLGAVRSEGLDYGRIRLWGSVSFIVASIASGAALASSSGERVLPLVLGASALVLLACLCVPSIRPVKGGARIAGIGSVAGDPRFWVFILAASALQASHQVYYGFGTLYWRSLDFSEPTIGWLWAEGVLAEILLFWQGRRLLARLGPFRLVVLRGCRRHPALEPRRSADLAPLHCGHTASP